MYGMMLRVNSLRARTNELTVLPPKLCAPNPRVIPFPVSNNRPSSTKMSFKMYSTETILELYCTGRNYALLRGMMPFEALLATDFTWNNQFLAPICTYFVSVPPGRWAQAAAAGGSQLALRRHGEWQNMTIPNRDQG